MSSLNGGVFKVTSCQLLLCSNVLNGVIHFQGKCNGYVFSCQDVFRILEGHHPFGPSNKVSLF